MRNNVEVNKNQGITLIALIITIIILLILVGVSINLVIKGDLFGSAEKAVSGTNAKVTQEQTRVDELMDELDQVTQNQCNHIWKNGKCSKCGKKLELVIGANIDYHEYIDENEKSVEASYTSTATTRGSLDYAEDDPTAIYSVVNNSGIQWIVLGEEDGQIKITTKNIVQPTSGGAVGKNETNGFKVIRFSQKQGYQNFISELNNIGAVYGKGKGADTTKFGTSGGRSFKKEDLGYELERTESCIFARHSSDGKIYRYESWETVDGSSTMEAGTVFYYLDVDASPVITEGETEWKELTADNPTMTFYDYVYRGEQTLPISISKADTEYWLASRGSYAGEYLWFTGLLVLSSGKDIGMSITDSNGVAVANTGERSSSSSVFEV